MKIKYQPFNEEAIDLLLQALKNFDPFNITMTETENVVIRVAHQIEEYTRRHEMYHLTTRATKIREQAQEDLHSILIGKEVDSDQNTDPDDS